MSLSRQADEMARGAIAAGDEKGGINRNYRLDKYLEFGQ